MSKKLLLVTVSCPDAKVAEELADHLLEKKLVACAQVTSKIQSFYVWNDRRESSTEVLLILKSLDFLWEKLEEAIDREHPYDTPEVIAQRACRCSVKYLDWVKQEVRDHDEG